MRLEHKLNALSKQILESQTKDDIFSALQQYDSDPALNYNNRPYKIAILLIVLSSIALNVFVVAVFPRFPAQVFLYLYVLLLFLCLYIKSYIKKDNKKQMRKFRHSLILACVVVSQLGVVAVVQAKIDPDDFQAVCVAACAVAGAAVGAPGGFMGALEGAGVGTGVGGPLCKSISNHLGISKEKQCRN